MPQRTMDRRSWMKATGLAALGAGLSACAVPRSRSRLVRPERSFVIPNISWDRIIRTRELGEGGMATVYLADD